MGFWFLPASSVLRSLSVISYQNWSEFVPQSSQEEVMKSMQRFVLYEQTFSWDFWLQIWKAGIHNEKHSYLVHNPCPSQTTIIPLCYMKLEDRFSLCLSCAYFHVIFKVFVIGLYWTRRLVVSRRLKWMELFQLIIFLKLFLTVTLMKHWIQSF